MMAVYKKRNLRYNVFNPDQLEGIYQAPIVSETRAPTSSDLADIGTIWIDTSEPNAYIIVKIAANVSTWQALSDIPTAGTDGQLWIGATGADPAWANLTSTGGSVTITNSANGVNLEAAGVAALTSLDGDSGTATPIAGVINIVGGSNIDTTGAGQNMTIALHNSVVVTGEVAAGTDLTMVSGTCDIESSDSAGQDIYLHANGGVGESIDIHADQGTGTDSIYILSDDGGVTIEGGLAAADTIIISASDAAGGIDMDCGTGGFNLDSNDGAIDIDSGTGAINLGTDAAAHTVTVGSTNTTAATVIQSGTGDVAVTSTDAVTVDAVGVLELNSSAGVIGIGNDAVAQNINIGTGAAARTITIGNGTLATAVDINCGTGDVTVGANATAHNTTIGSTNTTCDTIVQSGTGGVSVTSTGIATVDCAGVLELNSSAGVIGIGNDAVAQNINVGTGAAARTITVGNATGASSVVVNVGTGAASFGANATAHTTTIGSLTGAADTTIQAGSAGMILTTTGGLGLGSTGATLIDATGVVEINSDGAAIGIGNDADAFAINVGTGAAARTITVGNATGATSVVVNCGTGAASFGANAIAHTTTIGSLTGAADTLVQSGTGGLVLDSTGAFDIFAGTAIGINSDGGTINIGDDADAFGINIGTGAAARTITIGNSTGATAIDLTAGTGGITLGASGIVDMPAATATVAGVSTTINANVGAATFTGQTTASGAEQVFTVTNSVATTTSVVFATASNLGTNDAQMTLTRVEQKAGSIEFTLSNEGAAALNGNVVIAFWIIVA
jgi:hypothetical protein